MHNSRSLPILYRPNVNVSNDAHDQEEEEHYDDVYHNNHSHSPQRHLPQQHFEHGHGGHGVGHSIRHRHGHEHSHGHTHSQTHGHLNLHDDDDDDDNDDESSNERSTTSSNSDQYDNGRNRNQHQHREVEMDGDLDVEDQTHTSSSTMNNSHSHSQLRVGGYMDMNNMTMNEEISSSSEDDLGPSRYPAPSLYPSTTSSMRSTSTATLSSLGTFSKAKHQKPSQRYSNHHHHHHRSTDYSQQSYLPTVQNRKRGKKSSLQLMSSSSSSFPYHHHHATSTATARTRTTNTTSYFRLLFLSPQCLMFGIKTLLVFWIFMVLTFLNFHQKNNSPYKLPVLDGSIRPYASKHNTIPFPPPHEEKVSVVIMNYSRPRMIQESKLLPTVLSHPSIDEVILLHANPKTAFKFIHPKVVNIDASRENDRMGLSLRFYFCQLAKNDWVLHVDDDMEFTENTLNEMLVEFAKNTQRIVGRFGRNRSEKKMNNAYAHARFNGYSSKDTSKETEVILTKFMVMERDTCSAFFEYSHLIWEDIVLNNGEGPLWNGEDIFMSLVANHVYGEGHRNNYAMNWLDVRAAPEELKDYSNGSQDISGGYHGYRFWDVNWYRSILNRNRHYSYRGMLWGKARDRLATSGPYTTT